MNFDIIFFTILGLALLLFGANFLIKYIVILAKKINVSYFIIASCTVAFGTTIPELATSLKAVLSKPPHPGIAVGNLLGSNIANILFIIGLVSIINPIKINFDKLLNTEIKINFFIIFFPTSIILFNLPNNLTFYLSIIMLVALIYFLYERIITEKEINKEREYVGESLILIIFLIILSLIIIIVGSNYFINGSVKIAQHFNVSERIIGLSLVALGTSLPELITAIIAAIKKLQGIALGNVLGANAYNILGILGIVEIIEPSAILKNTGKIDILFLTISTILLATILMKKQNINRFHGLFFLASYILYIYVIYY